MSQLWSIKEPFPSDASRQSVDKAVTGRKDEGGSRFPAVATVASFPHTRVRSV